jgi:hypothetical protein
MRRTGWLGALLAMIAALGAIAAGGAGAAGGGPRAPSIEDLSGSRVRETSAELRARIDPHGAGTKYTFWVTYDPCQHGAGECSKGPQTEQVADGTLPARERALPVSTKLGDLKHGCLYTFWVLAKNSQGEAESSHEKVETPGREGLGCLR